MQNTTIILMYKNGKKETYTSWTKIEENHPKINSQALRNAWSKNTDKSKPIIYKNWNFLKCENNKKI